MKKIKWLVVLIVLVFLSETAYPAAVALPDYPVDLRQKIKELKDAARLKKEMPESISDVKVIDGDDAIRLLRTKKAIALDTRIKTQFEAERIQNAELLLSDELYNNPTVADKLDKSKSYIVYCSGSTCWRSPATVLMLQHLGFKKLYWYRGGMKDWKEKGYPTD